MTILKVEKLVRGRSRLRSFVARLFRYILISVYVFQSIAIQRGKDDTVDEVLLNRQCGQTRHL